MSEPRNQAVLAAPDVERVFESDRRTSLVEATLRSAQSNHHMMTGMIQPQIDKQHHAITQAQAQIGTQGEAIASAKTQLDAQHAALAKAHTQLAAHGEAITGAKTRLDTQHETLTGMQSHLTNLAETTIRHDQAIAFALLGEDAQIQQLVRRVEWLEHNPPTRETPTESTGASDREHQMRSENQALLAANEALFERVAAMEDAIRQLLARGPQGGGSRSTGRK